MKVSSSMMSTSVAISAASSRPDSSTRLRSVGTSTSRICAASSSEKPSSATSRKACRGRGVIWPSRCSAGRFGPSPASDLAFSVDRIPDLGEQPVERHPRRSWRSRHVRVGDQRLQGRGHIGVARMPGCRSGRAHSGAETADAGVTACEVDTEPLPFGDPKLPARTPPAMHVPKKVPSPGNHTALAGVGDPKRGHARVGASGNAAMGAWTKMKHGKPVNLNRRSRSGQAGIRTIRWTRRRHHQKGRGTAWAATSKPRSASSCGPLRRRRQSSRPRPFRRSAAPARATRTRGTRE